MIIAIDFDGTIVTHEYPSIGKPVPMAIECMKELQELGHQLILWTMRSGKELDEAVQYCSDNGVIFWGINENPEQKSWTNSNKQYANIYIDDASFNAPLINSDLSTRPYLDWFVVKQCLIGAML